MKFKAMKFAVKSPEHSAEIQKALFALGYKWISVTEVKYTDKTYLYTDREGRGILGWANDKSHFEEDSREEMTLEALQPEYCRQKLKEAIELVQSYKMGVYSDGRVHIGTNGIIRSIDNALDYLFPVLSPAQQKLKELEEKQREIANQMEELRKQL